MYNLQHMETNVKNIVTRRQELWVPRELFRETGFHRGDSVFVKMIHTPEEGFFLAITPKLLREPGWIERTLYRKSQHYAIPLLKNYSESLQWEPETQLTFRWVPERGRIEVHATAQTS
jgi:hypothetical protein